ncbi:MAG TPA: molybdopterin cofactor-binding domain-containing protein, partial [Chloroflexota bacterium]
MATVLTETRRRLAAPHQAVEHWADEPRGDSWDKVTGQAVYVEDLPDPPGMVHAAALRSPYSHARIVSIDTSKAERLPGVVGVLDREHLNGMSALIPLSPHDPVGGRPVKPGWGLIGDEQFLATDKVRYDGDVIAVVAAVDLRTARRAVELIEVEYDLLPVVFSAEEAFRPGASLLFEELGSNLACEDALEWGDVEQGLKVADHIFEETFTSQNVFHHPMEPSTPSIVSVTATGADVWAPVTSPFYIVQLISKLFNLPAEEIRVRSPYIGGGFGGKKENAELIGALVLSRRIGRPIKLITTAEESFRTAARHAMVYQAKLALTSDGRLTALDVNLAVDTGAYYTGAGLVAHNACISAWGCYRIPHFRV